MNEHVPPRLAIWLLQRLLDEPHADALIGDLTELYAEGRSRGWYWRHAFIAIAASHIAAVRRHAAPLATSLLAGWFVVLLWRQVNTIFIHHSGDFYWWLRGVLIDYQSPMDSKDTARALVWMGGALLRIACFALSGWIAAQLCPSKRMFAAMALTATFLLWPLPWLQLRIFTELQWLIHHGTVIAGVLAGASLASLHDPGNRRWTTGTTQQ
jgi:hypothetical protein